MIGDLPKTTSRNASQSGRGRRMGTLATFPIPQEVLFAAKFSMVRRKLQKWPRKSNPLLRTEGDCLSPIAAARYPETGAVVEKRTGPEIEVTESLWPVASCRDRSPRRSPVRISVPTELAAGLLCNRKWLKLFRVRELEGRPALFRGDVVDGGRKDWRFPVRSAWIPRLRVI